MSFDALNLIDFQLWISYVLFWTMFTSNCSFKDTELSRILSPPPNNWQKYWTKMCFCFIIWLWQWNVTKMCDHIIISDAICLVNMIYNIFETFFICIVKLSQSGKMGNFRIIIGFFRKCNKASVMHINDTWYQYKLVYLHL